MCVKAQLFYLVLIIKLFNIFLQVIDKLKEIGQALKIETADNSSGFAFPKNSWLKVRNIILLYDISSHCQCRLN